MQAQSIASQAEKRQRQYDKTIEEWRQKCTDIQSELDNASTESRAGAAEVFKLKAQIEETSDTIEALRRENKNLSGTDIPRHTLSCTLSSTDTCTLTLNGNNVRSTNPKSPGKDSGDQCQDIQ